MSNRERFSAEKRKNFTFRSGWFQPDRGRGSQRGPSCPSGVSCDSALKPTLAQSTGSTQGGSVRGTQPMASADSEMSRPPGDERDSQALSCLQRLREPGQTIQAEHTHLPVTTHTAPATTGHRRPAPGHTPSTLRDDEDITDFMRTSPMPNRNLKGSNYF